MVMWYWSHWHTWRGGRTVVGVTIFSYQWCSQNCKKSCTCISLLIRMHRAYTLEKLHQGVKLLVNLCCCSFVIFFRSFLIGWNKGRFSLILENYFHVIFFSRGGFMLWRCCTKIIFHSADWCFLQFIDANWTLKWLPTKLFNSHGRTMGDCTTDVSVVVVFLREGFLHLNRASPLPMAWDWDCAIPQKSARKRACRSWKVAR